MVENKKANFSTYEYKTVRVSRDHYSYYLDSYKNFGWVQDDNYPTRKTDTEIHLKRDKKIINKAELTRLQAQFEACVDEIATLEKSKAKFANVFTTLCAVLGTVLLTGSVFAVTKEPPIVWLCALLGAPGIVILCLTAKIHNVVEEKQNKKIEPFINEKYNEIDMICEKGYSLL